MALEPFKIKKKVKIELRAPLEIRWRSRSRLIHFWFISIAFPSEAVEAKRSRRSGRGETVEANSYSTYRSLLKPNCWKANWVSEMAEARVAQVLLATWISTDRAELTEKQRFRRLSKNIFNSLKCACLLSKAGSKAGQCSLNNRCWGNWILSNCCTSLQFANRSRLERPRNAASCSTSF